MFGRKRDSKYGGYDDENKNQASEAIKAAVSNFKITKSKTVFVFISILVVIFLFSLAQVFSTNKSGYLLVKQAAISGDMTVIFKEGVFLRMFAFLEPYPNSHTYYFSKHADEGTEKNESIPVTFRNGSTGWVTGSVRYTYPQIQDDMIGIHRRYRSDKAVYLDLVRTEMRKLVSMTASLLTPEAALTQKGIFYQYLTDQIDYGQYQTVASIETYEDPITKESKTRDVVDIALDSNKAKIRMVNPFSAWHVKLDQLVISDITPDTKTVEMIDKRRDAEMKIMVAKADAERARKETDKVIAEGQKAVAEKEYAALQEAKTATVNADREKTVAETNARKEREVATINAQREVDVNRKKLEAAELDKQTAVAQRAADISRGEGQAKARELIMIADGGLNAKLATFEKVMNAAFAAYAVKPVPQIVQGGGASGGGTDSAGLGFIDMMNIWAAKQLTLDMGMTGGHPPKK